MNTFKIQSHDLFISEKSNHRTTHLSIKIKQNGKNRDNICEGKKRDITCINVYVNCMWRKNERQRNEESQPKVLEGEEIKR